MASNDPQEAPDGGEDPRLVSLDERLKAAHHAEAERTRPTGNAPSFTGNGAAQGQRVLSTLIGAPLGGALIGWVVDNVLGTAPFGLLVMLFLGFGAAVLQVVRISRERVE